MSYWLDKIVTMEITYAKVIRVLLEIPQFANGWAPLVILVSCSIQLSMELFSASTNQIFRTLSLDNLQGACCYSKALSVGRKEIHAWRRKRDCRNDGAFTSLFQTRKYQVVKLTKSGKTTVPLPGHNFLHAAGSFNCESKALIAWACTEPLNVSRVVF